MEFPNVHLKVSSLYAANVHSKSDSDRHACLQNSLVALLMILAGVVASAWLVILHEMLPTDGMKSKSVMIFKQGFMVYIITSLDFIIVRDGIFGIIRRIQ